MKKTSNVVAVAIAITSSVLSILTCVQSILGAIESIRQMCCTNGED